MENQERIIEMMFKYLLNTNQFDNSSEICNKILSRYYHKQQVIQNENKINEENSQISQIQTPVKRSKNPGQSPEKIFKAKQNKYKSLENLDYQLFTQKIPKILNIDQNWFNQYSKIQQFPSSINNSITHLQNHFVKFGNFNYKNQPEFFQTQNKYVVIQFKDFQFKVEYNFFDNFIIIQQLAKLYFKHEITNIHPNEITELHNLYLDQKEYIYEKEYKQSEDIQHELMFMISRKMIGFVQLKRLQWTGQRQMIQQCKELQKQQKFLSIGPKEMLNFNFYFKDILFKYEDRKNNQKLLRKLLQIAEMQSLSFLNIKIEIQDLMDVYDIKEIEA